MRTENLTGDNAALLGLALTALGKVREAMGELVNEPTSGLVKSMHTQYLTLLTQGYEPPRFDSRGAPLNESGRSMSVKISGPLNISGSVARAFLLTLFRLSASGQIGLKWYDPERYTAMKAAEASVKPKSALAQLADVGKKAGTVATLGILAALGFVAYQWFGKKR